ncbi:hypothetical protein C8R42DRAFT_105354 [Lentinula raphanica]|nr:hypothetical protein C8R42DRAFT_105354 [Lentinula raphanica]
MLEEFCLSCGQHLSDDGRIYCSDECQNLDTVDPPSVSSTSLDTTRLWVEDHFSSSRRGSPSKIASSSGHLWSSQTESAPSARVSREHEQPSGAGLRNRLFDAVCLEDHQSDDPVYLSFRQGEILRVLDCDSRPGWWQASKTVLQDPDSSTNVVGWVPETYIGHLQFFNKY